jgi:hypothetical protein
MTKQEAISKHIAAAIVRNTRKRWASLYADVLEGFQMSQPIQHPKTEAQIAEQKHAEHVALQTRIAELDTRVAALEAGKN